MHRILRKSQHSAVHIDFIAELEDKTNLDVKRQLMYFLGVLFPHFLKDGVKTLFLFRENLRLNLTL